MAALTASNPETEPVERFTLAQVESAFREGYGIGADGAQNERRRKPFKLEDEAWDQWLKQHS